MANNKADKPEVETIKPVMEQEKVTIFVDPPMDSSDEPTEFISVNGVNYVLTKGKMEEVPKPVAEEYYRAKKAKAHLIAKAIAMSQQAEQQAKDCNITL